MSEIYRRKYGIDWPAGLPDVMVELTIAKKYKEFGGANASFDHPADHLLRACRSLFSPSEFTIHRWTEQLAADWTTEPFVICWGAAATGKSNTIGLFTLLDFVADPHDTVAFVGSTTLSALQRRSWESVIRYASVLKKHKEIDFSIHPKPSGYAILADAVDPDDIQAQKAGIYGVAIQDGGRMLGSHLPYVIILVDEMSALVGDGSRQAIEEAMANLKAGSRSLKFWGLANPTSHFDLSGAYSEPLTGWSSVTVDSETWRTKYGIVRHFDGRKSPAVVEPDGITKYPFLINQDAIDQIRNTAGEDSLRYSQMVLGWPPRQGNSVTVLTEADILAGKATDTKLDGIELASVDASSLFFRTIRAAAVDAAFSAGGDDAILQEARVIYVSDLPIIFFPPPTKIPILDSSDRPVTYQLVDFIRGWCLERDIGMDLFAADDSGSQSLSDVLSVEIGPGVYRVNYARAASNKPTNAASSEESRKKFRDCITEAWVLLAELVKSGQVRGLSEDCAKQLCARQYITTKAGAIQEPRRLEPKTLFKARTKLGSPDQGDAAAMVVLLLRHKLGILPGANVYPQASAPREDPKPLAPLSAAFSFHPDAVPDNPLDDLMGRYSANSD